MEQVEGIADNILSLKPDGDAGVEAEVVLAFAGGGLVVEEVFEADHPVEVGGEGGVELGAGDEGEVVGVFGGDVGDDFLLEGGATIEGPGEALGGDEGEVGIGVSGDFFEGEGGTGFEAEGEVVVFDEVTSGGEGGGGAVGDLGEIVTEEADAGSDEVAFVEDAIVTGGRSEAVLAGDSVVFAKGVGEVVKGFVFSLTIGGGEGEVVAGALGVAAAVADAGGGGGGPAKGGGFLFPGFFEEGGVVLLATGGGGAVNLVAKGGAHGPVFADAEVEPDFATEEVVGVVAGTRTEGDALPELGVFVELVFEVLGEANGGEGIGEAALLLPDVSGAGFEGE